MNTNNTKALQQKIKEIAQQKNADVCLACELALKLEATDFAAVKPLFEEWVKQLPQLSYEAQAALSQVWHCHATGLDFFEPSASLILAVRLKWWQTWLAIVPDQVVVSLEPHLLAKALEGVKPRDKASYAALFTALMADEAVWSRALLKLLKASIKQALLSYALFCKVMLYLFEKAAFAQLQKAYSLLQDFYFCFAQCPEVACRKLINRGQEFEVLGLKILALWGGNPLFEAILTETQWSIEAQLVALKVEQQANASSSLADRVVQWLNEHPVHSPALLDQLLAMAYEGVFCSEAKMTSLLHFYFAYDALSASDLALLLHHRFDQKLEGYLAHHATTPQKLIDLLLALKSEPAKEMLHEFLQENRYPNHFHQLLEALVALDYSPAEGTILTYLPLYPTACANALERLGGAKTIAHIKQVLQVDESKTHCPSFEREVLPLWLRLTDKPSEVLAYGQKNQLPNRFGLLPDLPPALPQGVQPFLLEALAQPALATQILALSQLATHGNAKALPMMLEKLAEADEELQATAWQYVQQLAQRLAQNIPAKTAQQLLAEAILEHLPKAKASAVLQRYLYYLAQCIDPSFDIDLLAVIGRSKDAHVLKFYIQCLGASQQPKAFYLIKRFLKPNQDIFTLRQALLALSQMPKSRHEKEAIALLQHRNMNIKKTAVAYLKAHGTQLCVLPLTQLLIRNDNSGLRAAIVSVLQGILGANLPFVLLHELSIAHSFIQQRFLTDALIDLCPPEQLLDFAVNYPKFELPPDVLIQNAVIEQPPSHWVEQWQEAQQRLRQLLDGITDLRKAIDQEPSLLNALPATQELMGQYLRNHPAKQHDIATWCYLAHQHQLILTDDEARLLYAHTNGGAKDWGWQVLSVDKIQEAIEWANLLHYKNPPEHIFLLRYFIPRKGLKAVLSHWLDADKNVTTFRKLLDASGMVPANLPQLLLAMHEMLASRDQTSQKQATQNQQAALANWLMSVVGKSGEDMQQKLFKHANLSQRLHLLGNLNPLGQSLLKREIIDLYTQCTLEQKERLLGSLKNTAQHQALLQQSFEEYLEGAMFTFWQFHPLEPAQIQALSEHPQAIEYIKQRQNWLPWGNELLRKILQTNDQDSQNSELIRSSFAMLPPERQWQILKPWLVAEELHWLDWLSEVAPIAPQILKLLQQASPTAQIQLLAWLNGLSGELFVPSLTPWLVEFCANSPQPLLAVKVLFKLPEFALLSGDFAVVFAGFDALTKTQLLEWLLSQPLLNNDLIKEVSSALRQYCPQPAHQALLWQMDVQCANYAQTDEAARALNALKKLVNAAPDLAVVSLEQMMSHTQDFSPRQRAHWLAELYHYPALEPTITQAIAALFADELLALTFLPSEVKARFEQRFCAQVKTQQLADVQLVRKVLKNFAEDPVPIVNELMEELVFHEKHHDLKVLCLRLLKNVLPHEHYLEVCYRLLHSPHLDLLRTAIRTLTFAYYTQAIPDFIKLLFHKDKNIAKAAQNALLHQGEQAIEALKIALPRQRPDKRVVLEETLALFG